MANANFHIKEGDLNPPINAVLVDAYGVVVDLTGMSVAFHLVNASTGAVKVNAAASIVTPLAGAVRYSWSGTDTDAAGLYLAEFEVTDGAGKKITFPNVGNLLVQVFGDLA